MYSTNSVSMSGISGMDQAACWGKCNETFSNIICDGLKDSDRRDCLAARRGNYEKCMQGCGVIDTGNRGGLSTPTSTSGAQNFLNRQALTVSAPRPIVSPARVDPTFSQVPAYSVSPVPFSAYGVNSTYGTYSNPVRLGNVETPAVDTTPEIFRKENLTKTIGITVGILAVGYVAYTQMNKKSTRRRR